MARETQGSPADEKKLEQYGVWVKVKPRDVTAPVLDESFELSDLEAPKSAAAAPGSFGGATGASFGGGDNELTAEEEKLLDELETELEPDSAAPTIAVPDEEPLLADSELPDIESASRTGSSDLELAGSDDEELPELEEDLGAATSRTSEPAEVEVTLSEDVAEEESFDDLAALENELASVTTKTQGASATTATFAAGGSAEILARIEEELKSIRADLTQLRTDLSGLRKSAAVSDGKGPSTEAGIKGGFLDEDEDETIALTGDELDNILNTAEITEEAAEATAAEAETDLTVETTSAESGGDILGYETPAPEPVEAPQLEVEEETPALSEAEITDDTLVLSDEDLLPADESESKPAAASEELPSDLVLEEIPLDDTESAAPVEGLPEIDLEGIPEIEIEPEPGKASAEAGSATDEESETIDLETLDLGEEPKVIAAVPEQVEEIPELEATDLEVADLEEVEGEAEEVTELPAEEVLEAEEVPAETAASETLPEVDLEALAAEAEDLEGETTEAPLVEDLEIGELETVAEEGPSTSAAQNEIEISFDGDLAEDVETLEEPSAEPLKVEEAGEAEEVVELEEAEPQKGGEAAAAGASVIPDNLKDEIRTVLKYMDHLLEALPDEKIQEFASSDYFVMYKKLFEDLGLGE